MNSLRHVLKGFWPRAASSKQAGDGVSKFCPEEETRPSLGWSPCCPLAQPPAKPSGGSSTEGLTGECGFLLCFLLYHRLKYRLHLQEGRRNAPVSWAGAGGSAAGVGNLWPLASQPLPNHDCCHFEGNKPTESFHKVDPNGKK